MRIYNYRYLIYCSAAAFCLAWAVSGWLGMSTLGELNIQTGSASKQKVKKPVLPDTDLITSKNIFKARLGDAIVLSGNSSDSPSAASSASAPGSSVPVSTTFKGTLLGVLTGENDGMAVIDLDGKKYILSLGVEQDGLTLTETGFYHVVVKQNGKEHKLVLQMPDAADLNNNKINPAVKGNYSKTPAAAKSGAGSAIKIKRDEVVKNLSDVNEVIKSVLIVPFEVNGEFQGYRVRRMTKDSILLKLGINRNDVIMRLNGKSLESPSVFFDALKNAENLSAITIDIMRGTEKITNYVEIEG